MTALATSQKVYDAEKNIEQSVRKEMDMQSQIETALKLEKDSFVTKSEAETRRKKRQSDERMNLAAAALAQRQRQEEAAEELRDAANEE